MKYPEVLEKSLKTFLKKIKKYLTDKEKEEYGDETIKVEIIDSKPERTLDGDTLYQPKIKITFESELKNNTIIFEFYYKIDGKDRYLRNIQRVFLKVEDSYYDVDKNMWNSLFDLVEAYNYVERPERRVAQVLKKFKKVNPYGFTKHQREVKMEKLKVSSFSESVSNHSKKSIRQKGNAKRGLKFRKLKKKKVKFKTLNMKAVRELQKLNKKKRR